MHTYVRAGVCTYVRTTYARVWGGRAVIFIAFVAGTEIRLFKGVVHSHRVDHSAVRSSYDSTLDPSDVTELIKGLLV